MQNSASQVIGAGVRVSVMKNSRAGTPKKKQPQHHGQAEGDAEARVAIAAR
ncbi:MAG: hypothetical protein R3D30_09840 [Hyphomicrobiales bacterium]